jgi:hypothetical protein
VTISQEDIDNRFTYHPPPPGLVDRFVQIRAEARQLAITIVQQTPESREQSLALTNLEQAVMWANAALARHPSGTPT